ncbi:hypothetical protein ET989_10825 [Propioniciclava sinopodophylli]|uniref:Uncharacterized protein n=1 Tax=Propioniciclava sinopodophylli TaxID=1837344 RepID=A0A4Q9KDX1_9ACTN|nr:hypothetical protein [Propioniciclava sinopodophylli]TBT83799.1 hypothetical protein ET989_10825 [Propioniciclava sinopodophylli]
MSAEHARHWARHFLDVWAERAGDPRLPPWLRVAALAYGSHLNNGHAPFRSGQVSLVLGGIDPTTGELTTYRNVARAIDAAVANGWLAPGSFHRCLIVPPNAIRKGDMFAAPRLCPLDHEHRERAEKQGR